MFLPPVHGYLTIGSTDIGKRKRIIIIAHIVVSDTRDMLNKSVLILTNLCFRLQVVQ